MCRKVLMVLVAMIAVAGSSFAQTKPDYSGTWKLNVTKSDFGPVPGPTAQTDVIEQSAQTIKIAVSAEGDGGKTQYTETLTTDGKEVAISADSPLAHPSPEVNMQSITASWDGPTLTVAQKLTYGGDPVTGVSHYTLSADGKVLTISSDYQTSAGDASRTFVFDKQDASMAAGNSGGGSTPSAPTGMAASADGGSASSNSASSASSSSSAKTNLSGTWVLDKSKSDFGQIPGPDTRTEVIEDKGTTVIITVDQAGGPMGVATHFIMNLATDGKQASSATVMGTAAKSTAHWDGSSLVVNTELSGQQINATIVAKYTLSADGNTLTVIRDISSPMGDGEQKFVYTKK